ncbi:MAG: hypothetical protein M1814_006201 [Vezdaea aestivalis]|nr:MAG: hypothetical protein M1814_006201 [Vezdaea aestivalis]
MNRFRKHRDKLITRRSEDDKEPLSNDETAAEALLERKPGLLSFPDDERQAQSWSKRASEPATRYRSLGIPAYNSEDTLSRHGPRESAHISTSRPTDGIYPPIAPSSNPNPVGLTLIYTSPEPTLDLIFIHGLGGSSRGTWSWKRDPSNFWPSWLGNDAELSRSRIFTYGYDAGLTGPYTTLSILDFAKDLLLRMQTYSGGDHLHRTAIGKLPILFVVHSMGGLVAKKAYIIGKSDPQFADIIASISGMVFLATPYKGSHLA